jgi:putative thioredoxin
MPLLEKKLDELKNFKLVKINTDENEELAGMLNITSVPTVFLVYKGNVIDSFVGFPDSQKLDNFFESINLLRGISQNEKIIRALLTGVDEFMSKKIYDRAENMLNEAYSHERWREKYAHIIKLGLAICAFHRSDFKLSEKFLKDLKMNYKNQIASDPVINKKLALLEIRLNLNTNPELLNKETENYYEEIEKNPTDLDLRYKLSVFLFENSEYEKAVENLLEIIQIERNWKNKAAQQFLIQIFNFLGADNSLTVEGRKKLMKILY